MENVKHSLGASGARAIHCYKLCGHNIVLDVASGSVHSVDDVVYDVVQMYEAAGGKAPSTLTACILERHADKTESDIRAIIDDIEKLISLGKLFTQDKGTVLLSCRSHVIARELATEAIQKSPANAPHTGLLRCAICAAGSRNDEGGVFQDNRTVPLSCKALCLNVSHACNMTCAYCFARESLNAPNPANTPKTKNAPTALMTAETGKRAIDFLVENSGARKNLDIDFFGGEPLLNFQAVKDIVAYARQTEKETGKKFRFTLTTNGLLIDDDVIAFTNKEIHNVVLSLDGRPEVHDAMRKLRSGAGSYAEVMPKIKTLVEKRRHKGYYIRGTFTRENMDFVNDILHLSDLGFSELSLEPAVAKRGDPRRFTKNDLSELFRQYDVLAVEMKRRKDNAVFVRPSDIPIGEREFRFYHYNLDLENGPCVHKRIAGCGVATEYMAVTPSGELYPCHQFVGDEAFLLGDVWRGVLRRDLREKFAAVNIYSRKECRECWARFYCSGGCAANAYHASGSINGVDEIGCELFKKRIENAIMLKF